VGVEQRREGHGKIGAEEKLFVDLGLAGQMRQSLGPHRGENGGDVGVEVFAGFEHLQQPVIVAAEVLRVFREIFEDRQSRVLQTHVCGDRRDSSVERAF